MSSTIVPIIIPAPTPSTCPQCKQNENKVVACAMCGYRYPETKTTSKDVIDFILVILMFIVGIWIILTIGYWILESSYHRYSLWEIIQYQWEFIKRLRIV